MRPGGRALAALADLARREAHGEAPPGADARGKARVLTAFRGSRRVRPWPLAAALVVASAVAFGAVTWARRPLDFTVGGTPAAAGVYVHGALDPAAATVRFGDGSEIAFAPGAGGRVAEVGAHGARVLLETGTASFSIAHRSGARWSVEAGPYAVAVHGTTFDVTWSAETQTLTVRLHTGEVAVTGPLAPRGVQLHAGQELTAVAGGDLRITTGPPAPLPSAGAATAVPPALPDPAPPPASPPSPTPAPSSVRTVPRASRDWPRRVAAGDFRGVVTDAEAHDVEAVIAAASLADLAALADAARYAGRTDLARRSLLAERTRFPASAEARAAAFLLGRIADDAGPPAAAVRWYDDYLREAPGGAFAAEALGRKLAALRRAGDPGARAAASEYLRRYPEGPYAAQAREIVEPP